MTNAKHFTNSLQQWNSVQHQAYLKKLVHDIKQTNSGTSIKIVQRAEEIHEKTQAASRKAQHAILLIIKTIRS